MARGFWFLGFGFWVGFLVQIWQVVLGFWVWVLGLKKLSLVFWGRNKKVASLLRVSSKTHKSLEIRCFWLQKHSPEPTPTPTSKLSCQNFTIPAGRPEMVIFFQNMRKKNSHPLKCFGFFKNPNLKAFKTQNSKTQKPFKTQKPGRSSKTLGFCLVQVEVLRFEPQTVHCDA